jgi:hypothetical protein
LTGHYYASWNVSGKCYCEQTPKDHTCVDLTGNDDYETWECLTSDPCGTWTDESEILEVLLGESV